MPTPPPVKVSGKFEYELWKLLSFHRIATHVQTAVGKSILELVEHYLGITAEQTPPAKRVRMAAGTASHHFTDGQNSSDCGRTKLAHLSPSRIAQRPEDATCGHCRSINGIRPRSVPHPPERI